MPTRIQGRQKAVQHSLAELLAKQPAGFKRHSSFPLLVAFLNENASLRGLVLSTPCYQLLNRGKLLPEHLENAYRTHHLPRHPFFPLFLLLKHEYQEELAAQKADRARAIAVTMKRIPIQIQVLIAFLAHLEETQERGHPLWDEVLFPKTKKQAKEMLDYSLEEWIAFLTSFIDRLIRTYKNLPLGDTEKLIACMFLECVPDSFLLQWPQDETVKDSFRRLSKTHHPDMGSDGHLFPHLVRSRDILLGNRVLQ